MLYGFCMQAGLAVLVWIFGRIGGAPLAQAGMVTIGALVWNLGVALGIAGVLAGDSTGFEDLEMPGYAVPMLCMGYGMIGLSAALTFHRRATAGTAVPQVFLIAALFWFRWIFSPGDLLLVPYPVPAAPPALGPLSQ